MTRGWPARGGPLERGLTAASWAFAVEAALLAADSGFLGRLGPQQLAASGVTAVLASPGLAALAALAGVLYRRVRDAHSAGEHARAGAVLDAGLLLCVAGFLPLGYALSSFAGAALERLGVEPGLAAAALDLLRVRWVGLGLLGTAAAALAFWGARGERGALIALIAAGVLGKLGFAATLVHGRLGARSLGGLGSAVSTVLAAVLVTTLGLALLVSSARQRAALRALRISAEALAELRGLAASLVLPSAVAVSPAILVGLALFWVSAAADARALAALTLAAPWTLGCTGLAVARDPRAPWAAVVAALLLGAAADPLMRGLSADGPTASLGVPVLRICLALPALLGIGRLAWRGQPRKLS